MDRHVRRKRGWKWGLRLYGVFIALTWLALLFVDLPGSAPSTPPDTTTSSPYLDQVAASLRQTHTYTDPLLAGTVSLPTSGLDGDPPVYAVALPTSDADGSAGDPQLVLAKLARLVGSDGVYAQLDQRGFCSAVTVKGGAVSAAYCSDLSSDELSRLRRAQSGTFTWPARVLYPLATGAGVCALVGWAFQAIGWVRRRRVAYLPGVR